MSVVIKELSPEVVGKRLGQNLYNASGHLLLRKGVEISPRFYEFFKSKGYRSIFLLDNDPNASTSQFNFDADRLLIAAPYLLRNIFRGLRSFEATCASHAKSQLVSLAESLLVHIRNTLHRPPHLLELKRQEDYLYQHSVGVAVYAIFIGRKLNFQDRKLLSLAISALLHDFGMEFVDESILNKHEKLSDEEFERVKEHTTIGFSHLVRNSLFDGVSTVAAVQHHERIDGEGYPNRLKGEAIHEYSRIISVSDFFDALTSDRPHRRLLTIEDALEFIKQHEASIFDAEVVRSFIEVFG